MSRKTSENFIKKPIKEKTDGNQHFFTPQKMAHTSKNEIKQSKKILSVFKCNH